MDSLCSLYNINIKDKSIYGWKSTAFPINENQFEIYVNANGQTWHEEIFSYLMSLVPIKQTVQHHVNGEDHLFITDKFWMESTVHHSLFTAVLRTAFVSHIPVEHVLNDLKAGKYNREKYGYDNHLEYMCKYGTKLLTKIDQIDVSKHKRYQSIPEQYQNNISVVHNYSGYVSACQDNYNVYGKQINALFSL